MGVAGYLGAVVVFTFAYAMYQVANNTFVMAQVEADQRGVVSGLLNMSRNLGLITGASLMAITFAVVIELSNIAIATRVTFGFANILILLAFAAALRPPAN